MASESKNHFLDYIVSALRINELIWDEKENGIFMDDIQQLMFTPTYQKYIKTKDVASFKKNWRVYGFTMVGRGYKNLLWQNGCLDSQNYLDQIPNLVRQAKVKGLGTCATTNRSLSVQRGTSGPRNGAAGGGGLQLLAEAATMDAKEFYDRLNVAEGKLQAAQVILNLILAGQGERSNSLARAVNNPPEGSFFQRPASISPFRPPPGMGPPGLSPVRGILQQQRGTSPPPGIRQQRLPSSAPSGLSPRLSPPLGILQQKLPSPSR